MKYYIFDKEKKSLMKDEDDFPVWFKNMDDVYPFLKSNEFTDDWIRNNFSCMSSCKILRQEELPEFQESIDNMPEESKSKIDDLMERNAQSSSHHDKQISPDELQDPMVFLLAKINMLVPKNHSQEVVIDAIKCMIEKTWFDEYPDMTLIDISRKIHELAYEKN